MSKKKAIKLAAATAVAASAFVAAAPAQTDAASNVATEVSKAVTQMKKAYHTYSDVTATGKFADIKAVYVEYNAAKKAYANAKAVVTKAGGASKDAYLAQLDSTYAEFIAKRVVTYIDAYNYAVNLGAQGDLLKEKLAAKEWDAVEDLYRAISKELKSRTVILDRVYGKSTRELLKAEYKDEAQAARDSIAYEVTVKIAVETAAKLVEAKDLAGAKVQLDKAAVNAAKMDKDANFGKALLVKQAEVVAKYEAALTPAVESVTAINAKQVVVKFNKAVDAKTLFVDASADTTVLKNEVFYTETTALNGNTASLSADGKSLTITAANNWEGTYIFKLAEDKVKSTDNKFVSAFAEKFSYEDTAAPSIVGQETVNAGQVKVKFSEPVKSIGNVTAKLADGTVVVPDVTFTAGNDYALINLTTDAGKSVTYTFAGALDYSDNLISPNPSTVTVVKGSKDGVAPEVSSVRAVNSKKFEIKLSEQAIGFTKEDVTVTGATVTSLTVDSTDKTKYVLEVEQNLNGKLVTVSVAADRFTDLSGENNKAFSKVIEVTEDSVKPTLTSAVVTKDVNGNEVLTLTLSEDVILGVDADTTVTLDAVKVKDYVTTPDTDIEFLASKLTLVEGTKNKYQVALTDVTEGSGAALVKGATYTVDLAAELFVDNAGLKNVAKTSAFSFTRDADTNSDKPALVKAYDSTQGTVGGTLKASFVNENGVLVTGNNTFKVKFDRAVDGSTATNIANYQVSGATVAKATLLAENVVEVTLVKDSNTFSGLRTVKVSGVKSSAGVVMSDLSVSEYFNENVRETVTGATVQSIVTDSNADVVGDQPLTTVSLTFSDVLSTVGSTADFELYINGSKVDATVSATGVDANKVTVTIAKALTATDFNNGVELRAASTIDIADAVGNVVNVANPVKLAIK